MQINKIQVKRGAGKPNDDILDNGEFGYDTTNKELYIGNTTAEGDAAAPTLINSVKSVNNKTGAIILSASDVGALSTAGGTLTGHVYMQAAPAGSQGYGILKTIDGVEEKMHMYISNTGYPSITFMENDTEVNRMVLTRNDTRLVKPLHVNSGGTGATTAADALTNLGLTATAAELNYCDGVTSNIQTQLNNKMNTSGTQTLGGSLAINDASNAGYNIGMTRKINSTDYKVLMQPTANSGNLYYYQGSTFANGMILNADSTSFRKPVGIASGGTGAVTADAALANLGGTKFDLLWENASPLAAFPSQNITITDLKNYRMVLVDCLEHWSAGAWRWYHASAIGQVDCTAGYSQNVTPTRVMSFGEEGADMTYRPFSVNVSGTNSYIAFSSGRYVTTYSSTVYESNNVLVPLRIYGIK